jgi:hypothetical protein
MDVVICPENQAINEKQNWNSAVDCRLILETLLLIFGPENVKFTCPI